MGFVCVDCDGVLLNMLEAIKEYLEKRGKPFYPNNVIRYNFEGDIGCKKSDVFNSLYDIELYKTQELYSNAMLALNKLFYSSIDVRAYTSSVNVKSIINYKACMFNRKYMMSRIKEADALFDDCLGVHKDWIDAGYKGTLYLIDAPYNSEKHNKDFPYFNRVIRCKDFNDAVNKYVEKLKYFTEVV